jgi:hypothetical protein
VGVAVGAGVLDLTATVVDDDERVLEEPHAAATMSRTTAIPLPSQGLHLTTWSRIEGRYGVVAYLLPPDLSADGRAWARLFMSDGCRLATEHGLTNAGTRGRRTQASPARQRARGPRLHQVPRSSNGTSPWRLKTVRSLPRTERKSPSSLAYPGNALLGQHKQRTRTPFTDGHQAAPSHLGP